MWHVAAIQRVADIITVVLVIVIVVRGDNIIVDSNGTV